MGNRRKAREFALQVLFEIEFSHEKLKPALDAFWKENQAQPEIMAFTEELVSGTLRNAGEIDAHIEGSSTNWKLSRMASVDRNLLRLATYELLYVKDIPALVTINEAVDIAKKFGTLESPSFINGILDKIAKEKLEGETPLGV